MKTQAAGKTPPTLHRRRLRVHAWLAAGCALAVGLLASPLQAQGSYGSEALRALAVEAVERQLPDAEIAQGANRTEVQAGAIDSRLRLSACDMTPAAEVDLSRGSGRYNVKLICASPAPWSLYVPVEVRVFRDTVVANRSMGRGEVVGPNDVRLEERNALAPGSSGLTRLEDAIGFELRRTVQVNSMLASSAVVAPLLVRRGDRLQISAHAGGITVGATAEAMRDGRKGDRIPARNIQSKRMVEVIVTGPGRGDIVR
jgi:flagella basal body P-ring formation protein FlgA